MIDEATVKEWLIGVTYRPGWKIESGGFCDERQWVIVWATAPDVCEPGRQFQTGPLFCVPEGITTRAEFLDWLIDVAIPGVEQHERYEWFRIHRRHWRNPHAPNMPAFATSF